MEKRTLGTGGLKVSPFGLAFSTEAMDRPYSRYDETASHGRNLRCREC